MTMDITGREAESIQKPKISKIWMLPILAVCIGLGLVYNNWQNRGIQIQIAFDTADGIVANKTVVKYLNVDIGTVNSVVFSPTRDHITIGVEIGREMGDWLRSDSEFWVVRPRVGAGGISGVGTLLTGAYIELSPGTANSVSDTFEGLNQPPVTPQSADGLHLTLTTNGGNPPSVGSPVIYRGFSVGAVESVKLDAETRTATYNIFIKAPYDSLVTTTTYFWNVGGISVNATAEGVKIDIGSLESIVTGGIQFDIPDDLGEGEPVKSNRSFKLFDSWISIENRTEYDFIHYAILVEDSVSGLNAGAPVEYRGIRIGTVESPYLAFDEQKNIEIGTKEDTRIPIIIRIEPARVFKGKDIDIDGFDAQLKRSIINGMAARLQSSNLLTGSLKVSLDFIGESQSELKEYNSYTVIPAKRSSVASITDQIDKVLTKIESLPIDDTVTVTNRTIASADNVMITLDKTLLDFRSTLKGVQPDSKVYESLEKTMYEFQSTLQGLKPLIDELSAKPNSLIFGGSKRTDAEPKARDK